MEISPIESCLDGDSCKRFISITQSSQLHVQELMSPHQEQIEKEMKTLKK